MAKLTMKKYQESKTIPELFEMYLKEREARGVSAKTLNTYSNKFKTVCCFYDFNKPAEEIVDEDINDLILNMKEGKRLDGKTAINKDVSIASYLSTVRSFFKWCRDKGYSDVVVPGYSYTTEPKELYTEAEIKKLIKKPNMKTCSFCEYRNWVIVCFILNSGCRSATLRNVLVKDLDFESNMILFRHTKNKQAQYVPMSRELRHILIEYLDIREGKPEEYLFPNQNNQQLSENALKLAIEDYNHNRGVSKTSVHLFRHFFAKSYIQNGGDCFRLQKILGHKKIEMTVHYANLYGADTKRGFEEFNPLSVLSNQDKRIIMNKKRVS